MYSHFTRELLHRLRAGRTLQSVIPFFHAQDSPKGTVKNPPDVVHNARLPAPGFYGLFEALLSKQQFCPPFGRMKAGLVGVVYGGVSPSLMLK